MDNEQDVAKLPAPEKPKSSILPLILAILGITVIGIGAGGAVGMMQFAKIAEVAKKKANETPDKADLALAWDEKTAVIELEPVITNLAAPTGVWIRIECAIVVDHERVGDVKHMQASLREDLLMFLRTVSLGELTGASALNHLRDDLNERVSIASEGAVRELIIENMVIQ